MRNIYKFYSSDETLHLNTLLKLIKSQCTLCLISNYYNYGCSLLRGWVCLWGLLSILLNNIKSFISIYDYTQKWVECRPARYLLLIALRVIYQFSPIFPYTNIINFFCLSQPHPTMIRITVWYVFLEFTFYNWVNPVRLSSIYSSMYSLYSTKSVCRVLLETPCIHRLVCSAIILHPYLWFPN